jgi:hypothetical protein
MVRTAFSSSVYIEAEENSRKKRIAVFQARFRETFAAAPIIIVEWFGYLILRVYFTSSL